RDRFGTRPTTQARWAAFPSLCFSREAKFGPSRFRTAPGLNPDEWLGRGRHRSRKAVGLRAIWKSFRTKSASRKLNLTDLKLEDIATGVFTPVLAKHSKSPSLIDSISVGVDRMQRNFEPMRKQVEAWPRSELTDVTAKVVIYEAFIEGRLEAPKHLARSESGPRRPHDRPTGTIVVLHEGIDFLGQVLDAGE